MLIKMLLKKGPYLAKDNVSRLQIQIFQGSLLQKPNALTVIFSCEDNKRVYLSAHLMAKLCMYLPYFIKAWKASNLALNFFDN